jgi:hypothetical protein
MESQTKEFPLHDKNLYNAAVAALRGMAKFQDLGDQVSKEAVEDMGNDQLESFGVHYNQYSRCYSNHRRTSHNFDGGYRTIKSKLHLQYFHHQH